MSDRAPARPAAVVFAVVVHWNDRDSTERCLASLTAEPSLHGVVVVDNGSRDDQRLTAGLSGRGTALLRRERNGGFAAAANEGATRAMALGATHLLFLNNDAVMEQGALDRLLEALAADPGAAAAGPRILDGSGERIWSAGGTLDGDRASVVHRGCGDDADEREETGEVGFLSFCAVLIPSHRWQAIGDLEDDFFAYYEDADWCRRAAVEGLRLLHCPAARVRHAVAASTGSGSPLHNYLVLRGRALYARRSSGAWPWILGRELPREVLSSLRRRGPAGALAAVRGLRDGVLGGEPRSYRRALGLAP